MVVTVVDPHGLEGLARVQAEVPDHVTEVVSHTRWCG
jgi:hypothetical protein